MRNSRVLVCYNEPVRYYSNYIGKNFHSVEENIDLSESEFMQNIETVLCSLRNNFQRVDVYPVGADIIKMISFLTDYKPDIIYNFVESVEGNSEYECYIAGLFDLLGFSYTGNSSMALGNCLVKARTKHILQANKILTPNFFLANYSRKMMNLDEFNLTFPVIAKLIHEDASIGISELSVIHNKKDLMNHLNFLFENYKQDVIIEEFIDGRELNISVLGEEVLPISEIKFDGLPDHYPKIITYEAKWSAGSIYYENTTPHCPAELSESITKKIKNVAFKTFQSLGCRDYARVDIRLDKNDNPYVIEVNPNPDISLDSGFIRSAKAANISYDELLIRFAEFALRRKQDGKKISTG